MKQMNECKDVHTVAIAGHIRPDGDCVGSCMAFYQYIKENYPEMEPQVYLEEIPPEFHYLANVDQVKQAEDGQTEYDLFIALDVSDKDRLGCMVDCFDRAKRTLCIDHHISNTKFAMKNLVIPDAAATCEILFYEMEYEKISQDTATALYTGLVHDSGVFKYSNTTEKTMTAAGKLISKGVPFTKIIEESFYQKTYLQNQILGRALLESIRFFDKKCIAAALRKKELDFYGVGSSDLSGIVSQLLLTKGVECAIFMYETSPHVFKISLRSKDYLDVSAIASHFGGGGHVRAAGCTMMGNEYDVINNISTQIARQMEKLETDKTAKQEAQVNQGV